MEFISFDAAAKEAIVAALGDSNEGAPADRPDLHGDLPGLPGAVGRGVAKIHQIQVPASSDRFDVEAAIAARLNAGLIDPGTLPEPYDRYEADRLVEIWTEAVLPDSYHSEPVVLAGSLTIDRMFLTAGELTGLSGDFGMVGDRHLDLAVIQYSIHHQLGAEAVFGLYEAYGADPNIVVLDHYVLAGLLLGWIS